jgi:hypothetical protein
MIAYEPDWLTPEMIDDAVATATTRLDEPPASLRLERYPESLSVQIMHVGRPAQKRRPLPGCTGSFCRRTT